MLWLLITILAYLFLALASLADRYLLVGPLKDPKSYAFFVGLFGMFSLVLVPFGFEIPAPNQIFLSLSAGVIWIFAIFLLYSAILQSEVSKIVPAIGGFLPIFTFFISRVVFSQEAKISFFEILAFSFLVFGSVLISLEKKKEFLRRDIKLSGLCAFFFAIGFFLMKAVYLQQTFISGFIWMRFGGIIFSLLLLIFPEVRKIVFSQGIVKKTQISLPLVLGQIAGGVGFMLQSFAVFLASPGQLPMINALEGIRYAFLLFFVLILSKISPQILKEQISGKMLLQKVLAIGFIGIGLALMAFNRAY